MIRNQRLSSGPTKIEKIIKTGPAEGAVCVHETSACINENNDSSSSSSSSPYDFDLIHYDEHSDQMNLNNNKIDEAKAELITEIVQQKTQRFIQRDEYRALTRSIALERATTTTGRAAASTASFTAAAAASSSAAAVGASCSGGRLQLYRHDELQVDTWIASGGFSDVHRVRFSSSSSSSPPSSSLYHHEWPAQSCGDGRPRRYVIKTIRHDLVSDEVRFALAAIDLVKEAVLLSVLDHKYILKTVGVSAMGVDGYGMSGGRPDSFFLVLPEVDTTLEERLMYWKNHNANRRWDKVVTVSSTKQRTASKTNNRSRTTSSKSSKVPIVPFVKTVIKQVTPSNNKKVTFNVPIRPNTTNNQSADMIRTRLSIALQLADAMRYLHSHRIMHRDLKPANIGLVYDDEDDDDTRNSRVQLFDFGCASILPRMSSNNGGYKDDQNRRNRIDDDRYYYDQTFQLTAKSGSPRYLSPENWLGRPYNLSSDVYSFALVMYYIVTLDRPYDDMTARNQEYYVCRRGVRPPLDGGSSIIQSVPGLSSLLTKAWSQNPTDRPTMQQVYDDLDSMITG